MSVIVIVKSTIFLVDPIFSLINISVEINNKILSQFLFCQDMSYYSE